jgi:ubiquinone biosynthesis UbiH/UbiF/VisC/COQ6 family hydroxylase
MAAMMTAAVGVAGATTPQVCVLGGGAVGTSLALALAAQGLSVSWVTVPAGSHPGMGKDPAPHAAPSTDLRAYALNAASVALLRELKVWDALPAAAITPVRDMRVHGDRAGALLEFSAWRQHLAELACIVDAASLERCLHDAARYAARLTRVEAVPTQLGPDTLVAHCEGRGSDAARQHGLQVQRDAYGHLAVAARLVGEHPHQGVAHQWFRSPDVLALLPVDQPVTGRSWALVWSAPEALARQGLAESEPAFEARLQQATGGSLGPLALASPRASWPLARVRVSRWCGPGWVLLGDAAHQVHPLAGQGLNLGLADVAALARVLKAREPWRPIGDERLLRRYERERLVPVVAMSELTDALWQLFASPMPGLRTLRNTGLAWVNRSGVAKRWLVSRALDR